MHRETESNLQTCNFDPIPSESRNWPDENLQGQAVHENNCWILKYDAQTKQSIISLPKSSSMAHIDLTQLERVHTKASSQVKRLRRSVSPEKPPLTMIDEKPTDGTSTSKKDQDGHGVVKSENFKRVPKPDDELKSFLSRWSWSDECCFFPTDFWRVPYTCSSDYSVYDSGEYKHSPVARTFFCTKRVHNHICTLLMRDTYTHGSSVCEKVCCMRMSLISISFSLLMSHPSLLIPHGHFETTPDYDFTDDPVHTFLPYLPVPKAQDTRNSARAPRSLATWPNPVSTQVMIPKSSTRILPWMMTRRSSVIRTTISPTSRKSRTRTPAKSVFTQCLNPLFCTFPHDDFALQIERAKKACNRETVARQREREEREGFVISAAESMSEKSQRNGICVSLKSYRKFSSEESQKILFWWMRSPRTSATKSSTSHSSGKFRSEKIMSEWVRNGDPKFRAKKFRIHIDWVTAWACISKTTIIGSQAEQAQRERIHLYSR